jgi:hypothetical protein
MAPSSHALLAVQDGLKSISNERDITLEAETVFRPYLPSHCSGVVEIGHMALSEHALPAVEVRLKSVSNEGHFTLEADTLFRPYFQRH